jgi:hypothetical protein
VTLDGQALVTALVLVLVSWSLAEKQPLWEAL